MDTEYRARKEAFVSDLSGGNIMEVGNVLLVPLVSMPGASSLDLFSYGFKHRLQSSSGLLFVRDTRSC